MTKHLYSVGEKVYFGDGEQDFDVIVEQVTESGMIGYELENAGFIFESSIAYSEKELKGTNNEH